MLDPAVRLDQSIDPQAGQGPEEPLPRFEAQGQGQEPTAPPRRRQAAQEPVTPQNEEELALFSGELQRIRNANVERDRALLASFRLAAQEDPELAGEAQSLARKLGVDPATATRNIDVARAMVQQQALDLQEMRRTAPTLYDRLQDVEFTKVAHDDVANLSETEGYLQLAGRHLSVGTMINERGIIGLRRALGWASPEELDRLDELDVLMARGQKDSGFIASTAEIVGQMAQTMPIIMGAGAAAAAPAVVTGAGAAAAFGWGSTAAVFTTTMAITAGNEYNDLIARGVPHQTALLAAFGAGAGEGALEAGAYRIALLPFQKALSKSVASGAVKTLERATVGRAWGEFVKDYAKTWLAETGVEVAQEVNDYAFEQAALARSDLPTDGLDTLGQRMWQTFVQMGQGMTLLALPGPALNLFSQTMQARQAQRQAEWFSQFAARAEASKVRPRDAAAYSAAVDDMAAAHGVDDFHVDGRALGEALRQADLKELEAAAAATGIPVEKMRDQLPAEGKATARLRQLLPDVADQLGDAEKEGGTVAITPGEYAAHLAGTEVGNAIAPHLRFGADGLTVTEAAEHYKQIDQQVAAMVEQTRERAAKDEEFAASLGAVKQDVLEQLRAAGQFSAADADAAAEYFASTVAAAAAREGKLPADLWGQNRATILGGKTATGISEGAYQSTMLPVPNEPRAEITAQGPPTAFGRQFANVQDAFDFYTDDRSHGDEWAAEAARQVASEMFSGDSKVPESERLQAVQGDGKMMAIEFAQAVEKLAERLRAAADFPLQDLLQRLTDPNTVADSLYHDDVAKAIIDMEDSGEAKIPDGLLRAAKRMLKGVRRDSVEFGGRDDLQAEEQALEKELRKAVIAEGGRESFRQELSTRLPTGQKATSNPNLELLTTDVQVLLADKPKLALNAQTIRGLPFLRLPDGLTDEQVVEAYVQHVVDNLEWLFQQMAPADRERSRKWYDGGRRIVGTWAARYGISDMQAAAVLAVLSPQKQWFQNVTLAERILDIAIGLRDYQWDDRMTARAQALTNRIPMPKGYKVADVKKAVFGRRLSDLTDKTLAAYWVRIYDQTHNSGRLAMLAPEGGTYGQYSDRLQWSSYATVAKVLSVLEQGSAENVSLQLGLEHKVRSFYNNLFAPNSRAGHVTIDTHAVAAAYVMPLSSESDFVTQAWGGKGGTTSKDTGLLGFYPILAEAYRRVGEAHGLLPREVQSITWEQTRAMFTAAEKRSESQSRKQVASIEKRLEQGKITEEEAQALIDKAKEGDLTARAMAIWGRFRAGEISQQQARDEVLAAYGGFGKLGWEEVSPDTPLGDTYVGESRKGMAARDNGAAAPNPTKIMVEAKPNTNPELLQRWEGLNPGQRLLATNRIIERAVAAVLQEYGVEGRLISQRGAWMGAPEASVAVQLDRPHNAYAIAARLGELLHQEGMYVTSMQPAPGLKKHGAVSIDLPAGYTVAQIDALYQVLWGIQLPDGTRPAVGHSSSDGHMVIGVDPEQVGIDADTFGNMAEAELKRQGFHLYVRSTDLYLRSLSRGEHYATSATQHPAAARPSAVTRSADLQHQVAALYEEAIGTFERADRLAREESAARSFRQLPASEGGAVGRDDAPGEFATRTTLAKVADRQLGTDRVVTAEDAATAMAYLARGAAERFDALVTDENGKPLAVIGSFKGGAAYSHVGVPTIVLEAFRVAGARAIWFAHNHPSGASRLSSADVAVWNRLGQAFAGSEIEPKGLLAIGGSTAEGGQPWEMVAPYNAISKGTVREAVTKATVPVTEREFSKMGTLPEGGVPMRVDGPLAAKAAAIDLSQGRTGALLLSTDRTPIAFIPFERADVETLREQGRMDAIYRAVSVANATGAVIVEHKKALGSAAITNVANLLRSLDVEVLDVVDAKSPTAKSWTELHKEIPADTFQAPDARGEFFPQTLTILLHQQADLSTFLHETAHYWLTVFGRLASSPDASESIQRDMATLLQWFGVPDLATWNSMSIEQQRPHHEAFAYSFETYLFDNQAPSLEMQSLFSRFSAWLKNLYGNIRDKLGRLYEKEFGKPLPILTGEVRQVMDRMLAGDDEIQRAEWVRGALPHFQTREQSGMDEDTWAMLQETFAWQHEIAAAEVARRDLKTLSFYRNAKSRALKAKQKQFEKQREVVRQQVQQELESDPLRRAQGLMAKGLVDKMDAATVEQLLPPDQRKAGMKKLAAYVQQEGGQSPDEVARLGGMPSGDALVRALLKAPPLEDEVDQLTAERMKAQFPELSDPRERELAVEAALHNEMRARFVAIELQHASKGKLPWRVMLAASKEAARLQLERTRLRDIRPKAFSAAEARARKAAGEAMRSGTEQGLARVTEAVRAELLQHQLARQALDISEEIRAKMRAWQQLWRSDEQIGKVRDLDRVQAARAILTMFKLGALDSAPSSEYLDKVRLYDPDLFDEIKPLLDKALAEKKDYRDLTLEEWRGLVSAVDSLWFNAKRDREMRIGEQMVRVERASDESTARLEAIGVPQVAPGEKQALTRYQKFGRWLNNLKALVRRVEHWAKATDGPGNEAGPFTRYIWRPVSQAIDTYRLHRNQLVKHYIDLVAKLRLPAGKIDAQKELGYTFGAGNGGIGKAEVLGALLHSGNLSNLRKLLLGRWADHSLGDQDLMWDEVLPRWQAFLKRMVAEGVLTKGDFEWAQKVWDLNEGVKPMAQKAHHDLFGRYFKEVKAEPFTVQFPDGTSQTFRGGYVPASQDAELVRETQIHQKLETLEADFRAVVPSTGMGFTKARVDVNRKLALDIRQMVKHLDDVVRFVHVQPAVRDVMRLLRDDRFASTLTRLDPNAIESMLIPWLQRAARQTTNQPGMDRGIDNFWRAVRQRTGMASMFANISNALQQVTGLFISALKVKGAHLRPALWQVLGDQRGTAARISGMSSFMADRLHNQIFDLADALNELTLNPSKFDRLQAWSTRHAYFLQSAFQNTVDKVTWIGAYNQAVEELGGSMGAEDEAVARADAAVRQTQGSIQPEDVAKYQASTPFLKTITQFSGYFNMLANVNADELIGSLRDIGWKSQKARLFQVYLLGFLAPMLISDAIAGGLAGSYDDEDDDGYGDELASWFFGGQARGLAALVPVFGPAIAQATTSIANRAFGAGYSEDRMSTSPSVRALEAVFGVAEAGHTLVTKGEIRGRGVRDVSTLLSLIFGVPVSLIGRTLGYQVDVNRGKVEPYNVVDYARGLLTGRTAPGSRKP